MTPKHSIFIIEDDNFIRRLVEGVLVNNGYVVSGAESAETALKRLSTFNPSLIILDLHLPDMNGLECCKKIRANPATSTTPIVFLSAHHSEVYRITALESGADDFIPKPFSPGELVARVKAILRRASYPQNKPEHTVKDKSFVLDKNRGLVTAGQKEVVLTPKEFAMLELFVQSPGKILSRDHFSVQVWEHENIATSRTIDVHLARLRRKLGKFGQMIETVGKLGYKYNPAILTEKDRTR